MRLRFVSILALVAACTAAQPSNEEREAIAQLEKGLAESADPGAFMHAIAINYAVLGEKEPAIKWLRKVCALYPDFDPSGDRYLRRFAPDPEFRSLVEAVHKAHPPVLRAKVAFRIPEADLVPEGIAYDPEENALYIGSINKRKIVRVSSGGEVRDFAGSGQDGLTRVLGMKVHAGSRTLWAVSNSDTESGVFHFDLRTGKLLRKYLLTGKPKEHLFNDLVVTRAGSVFFTDTYNGSLYRIPAGDGGIEPVPGLKLLYANGIALSPDERTLFVAHFNGGISTVDIASGKARILPRPPSVSTAGIDGLYVHKDSLVAVQNAFGNARVIRYFLSPARDRVERAETLEYRNPLFHSPTTAAVAGDALYFMANTALDRYEDGRGIRPGPALGPLIILKLGL